MTMVTPNLVRETKKKKKNSATLLNISHISLFTIMVHSHQIQSARQVPMLSQRTATISGLVE